VNQSSPSQYISPVKLSSSQIKNVIVLNPENEEILKKIEKLKNEKEPKFDATGEYTIWKDAQEAKISVLEELLKEDLLIKNNQIIQDLGKLGEALMLVDELKGKLSQVSSDTMMQVTEEIEIPNLINNTLFDIKNEIIDVIKKTEQIGLTEENHKI
jgi:tryptophanyl-tRNA synthetase